MDKQNWYDVFGDQITIPKHIESVELIKWPKNRIPPDGVFSRYRDMSRHVDFVDGVIDG